MYSHPFLVHCSAQEKIKWIADIDKVMGLNNFPYAFSQIRAITPSKAVP